MQIFFVYFAASRPAATSRAPPRAAGGGGGSSAALNAQIEDLNTQLMESKLTIEGLEKERDFYFGKLRDIEVLAQEHETDGGEFAQKTLAVLYATEVKAWSIFFDGLLSGCISGRLCRARGRRRGSSTSGGGGVLNHFTGAMTTTTPGAQLPQSTTHTLKPRKWRRVASGGGEETL